MTLSVVVIDCEAPDVVQSCIESLKGLGSPDHAVDVSVLAPEPGESLMQVRARAAAGARSDFVVFLNPRYRLTRGWASAILEGHAAGSAVVGGCVVAPEDSGNGNLVRDRAIYLWEYAPAAAPPAPPQDPLKLARSFPGGNTSYQTELLRRYDIGQYPNEMDFHGALAQAGHRLHRSAQAAAVFVSPRMKEHFAESFRVSRNYAGSRGESGPSRVVHAGGAVVALVPYLLLKNSLRVWRNPALRPGLLPSLPWFVVFAAVQTAGAITGYLRPDASVKKRLHSK